MAIRINIGSDAVARARSVSGTEPVSPTGRIGAPGERSRDRGAQNMKIHERQHHGSTAFQNREGVTCTSVRAGDTEITVYTAPDGEIRRVAWAGVRTSLESLEQLGALARELRLRRGDQRSCCAQHGYHDGEQCGGCAAQEAA